MKKTELFAARLSGEERQMFAQIAERLQRTEADTFRLLIRETARALGESAPQTAGSSQASQASRGRES